MTISTRNRVMTDKTFDHVVLTLMGMNTASKCHQCLVKNGITTAAGIASMDQTTVELLRYDTIDSSGNVTEKDIEIPPYQRHTILLVGDFLRKVTHNNGGTLSEAIILQTDKESFDTYRVLSADRATNLNSIAHKGSNNDALSNFIKGVKRDKSQYPELKDERHFENWKRSFVAIAKSHRIDEVFDPLYVPTTPEDIEVFAKKQKFAYTFLDEKICTDMGKTLVRKHEVTGNAQLIWAEFVHDAKLSTKAQINSSDILSWITSAKFDSTWRGTSHGFILYWINKVKDYDSFTPDPKNRFTESLKLTLLQNTVSDTSELRQVRINADMEILKPGGNALTYQQYVPLLLSAAHNFDKTHSKQVFQPKKQQVFTSSIDYDVTEDDIVDDDTDIINIDTYLTNVTSRKPPIQANRQRAYQGDTYQRPYIERNVWATLPKDIQQMLLGTKTPPRVVDSTKVNNVDQLVHSHDTDNLQTDTISGTTRSDGEPNNLLLNHMSQESNMSSTDIRKVISTSYGVAKKGEQHSHSNDKSLSDDIINVNGTSYRKINMTLYRINHKTVDKVGYSLVDRGANGGVLGSDAYIIETTGRLVSIVGLDNHQVSDIPICTGAGYTRTQHGPVIIIMHQYAYLGHGKTIHSSVQMEHYKLKVHEKSLKAAGGSQRITTPDGYVFPVDIIQGLPYIKMRRPTEHELQSLPHVIITSDVDWDPSVLDNVINDDDDSFYDADDYKLDYALHPFNEFGTYLWRTNSTQ